MTVPDNVLKFEAALYTSLLLDTISTAVQAMSTEVSDAAAYGAVNIINALFILGFTLLVGIAARRRKNWARMLLLAVLVLSTISLVAVLSGDNAGIASVIDLVSIGITAYGIRCSFRGDARGWFTG